MASAAWLRRFSDNLILAVSIVFIALALLAPAAAYAGEQATVKGAFVNLRDGPSAGNALVGKALQGEKLEILSRQGDWYKVKKGGRECWVAGWLVTVSKTPTQATAVATGQAVVKGTFVNLRESPNTSSRIMGKAVQGEKLEVLSKQGEWYKVKKGGQSCWVAGWLVDIGKATPAPQVPVSPTPSGNSGGLTAEITADRVNIRSGPGTGFGIVGQATLGGRYSVQDKSGNWYKVSTGGGSGWVYGELVKVSGTAAVPAPAVVPAPASVPVALGSPQKVVSGSEANIRSGPGTDYNVVSRAGQGERVQLLDKSNDWYKVKQTDGSTGWMVAWLLEEENENSTTPTPGGAVNNSGQDTGMVVPPPKDNSSQGSADGDIITSVLKKLNARSEGSNTAITIESDGKPINYTINTLSNPYRLVVDISGMGPGQVPENISLNAQLVDGIRVGLFDKTIPLTRVVIDLKERVSYEKVLSSGDSKLQITVTPRKAKKLAGSVIVLDPGHGGSDPGASGRSGLTEKSVNMDIALKAAQILRSKGATVILTRTGDSYVDLQERPEIANKNEAALFVSIHSNANDKRDIAGTSTYYLRTPEEGMGEVREEGMHLAQSIQSCLMDTLKRQDRGVLQANFVVLVKSKVPAALVEVAYISNPEEEKMLADEAFRLKAASAIVEGITDYFKAD